MKKLALILACIFCNGLLFPQPFMSPGVEWQQITWAPSNYAGPQTQNQSGDDWWYCHKNFYTGNQHIGYVSSGYSAFTYNGTNLNALQNFYNEGPNSCYNPYTNPPGLGGDCEDLFPPGVARIAYLGTLGYHDLKGNLQWFKSFCIGDLQEVIQDGNFLYACGYHVGTKNLNHTAFLKYNPSVSNPNDNFDNTAVPQLVCNDNSDINHIYVAKFDLNGNVIWENIYGISNYGNSTASKTEALYNHCLAYGLTRGSDGNIYVSGVGPITQNSPGANVLLFKLDPTNGYVLSKAALPYPSVMNNNLTVNTMEGRHIAEIGNTGNFGVTAIGKFSGSSYWGFVFSVDQNLNLNLNWPVNPVSFPANQGNLNSNCSVIKYHTGLNELMVGVLHDCVDCYAAGTGVNTGFGKIFRLTTTGALSAVGTNPSFMGAIRGFDLRIGVDQTADGGFVAVSTGADPNAQVPPTAAELGPLLSTPGCSPAVMSGFSHWDTNPLVTKFNSAGTLEWSKNFDVIPGRARQTPPGDLKRQECVYHITQAQDGGFVISGNTSHNFDDNYLFKLYEDCDARQIYDISNAFGGNVINIFGQLTWNTSHKVLGKVVVKPGATLTITGPQTLIEFADSKRTGILTNITVEAGGRLIITNGASLSSLLFCPTACGMALTFWELHCRRCRPTRALC